MPFDPVSFAIGAKAGAGGGGGGGDITVVSKSIGANGTYTAPAGKAYSPVIVDVPNSYTASDEGKVVSNGALVAQTSDSVTHNGTVDTTLINSLTVNVSGSVGAMFAPMDYPVTLTNKRASGTISFSRLSYDQYVILYTGASSNITVSNSANVADFVTDGTHIWFRATNVENISYNGESAEFLKSGSGFMLTIPDGFDGTIPFLLS